MIQHRTQPALDIFLPYTSITRKLAGRRQELLQQLTSLTASSAALDDKRAAIAHATATASLMTQQSNKRKAMDIPVPSSSDSLEQMQRKLTELQLQVYT